MTTLILAALLTSVKGYWSVEAGIRKYMVGRDRATSAAEAKAAYDRPVGGKTWKILPSMSLDEVNDLEVLPGDKVLFQCGGVWRGQLQPRSGKPGHPIVFGSFGEGAKPVIQPSLARQSLSDWREVGAVREGADRTGLWKTETGAVVDIGNVIFDHGTKGCAFRRGRLEDVKSDLDYWCDPKSFAVYLKSTENPATRFKSIELCEKMHCIEESMMHDIVYDGLALRYTAAHGIGGGNVKRITVRNCDIGWIGGGYLYYDKLGNGVRYGNGIEFWSGCEDVLVESNRVYECWDAALTNQSNIDGAEQKNIVWRDNEVWNSEYSYEYWQQGDNARTENVVVERNRFRDAGKGWGHRQRWNPNAAHLMFYDTTAVTRGFVVRDNVFSRSEDTLFRFFNDWRAQLTMKENQWVSGGESICRFHGRPTANLVYRYPDRLDQIHDDNLAEIESQTVSKPRVFRANELQEFLDFLGGRGWVVVNEDNDHYFKCDWTNDHWPIAGGDAQMTVPALEAYADLLTASGKVTHVFWCTCGGRPSFDSKAWEPIWYSLTEEGADFSERGCGTRRWPENARLLHQRGIDPYKVWIARCHRNGSQAWISMRMNDTHFLWLNQYFRNTTFCDRHPELNVKRRKNAVWESASMDYSFPTVREHHMRMFKELVDRYEADGIELDFCRSATYFPDDKGVECTPIMTEFIREAAAYAHAKRGRKYGVAVRVLPDPSVVREKGFDIATLAKEGSVDVVIPCLQTPCSDGYVIDYSAWQSLLKEAPEAVLVGGTTVTFDATLHDAASLAEWSAAMSAKGWKNLYLFNLPYKDRATREAVYFGDALSIK